VSTTPDPHHDDSARLTLGPDSAPLRRELGPVAWCALECLVARSDPGRNGTTAAASVRSLAVDLGVAKNTAHRAISALVRAGLITSVQDRLHDGRFRAGEYRLHVDGILTATRPKPARRPAPASHEPTQLSLLGPA